MEKQKYPEVRFNGFSENWEHSNFLDNIQSIIDFRGRTPKKLGMDWSKDGYLALSALNVKNGYIDPKVDAHYGDEKLYQKWMAGNELKKGQVLFTTEAPMGNVAQVPDNRGYILSQRTIAFNVKDNKIVDDFLAVLLGSPNVFNTLSGLSSGGTAKGVSQKSLSGLEVIFAKDLAEQEKIGNFFQNLDQSIALHEKKLTQTQNFKKAMLEKMFPKHGSKRPEIRLKGFSGDWSSYSVFDLSKNSTLSNGVFNDQNKVGKGYKLINVLDMYLETSIDENRLTLLDLDKREFEQNKVNYGDIFFTRSSLVKEGIAFSNVYLGDSDDITYDGHLIKLSPNLNIIDPIFLNYCLKSSKIRKQLILGGKSTTMTTIGQQEVGSTLVDIPSIQEQKKIGIYFKKIDETLNLKQQQLQTLKNLKQALLEKMFV
ncbi:hypothetical protein B9T26_07760 [Acinetobacter sp. ANC 4169]|uniref:restriction endonuclease subunit S n=1 Tax=Acinetobacter sp. ANC 4169 TaxID=1977879 RepID=UPI000B54E7DE|nr:restriction endonuclease subunit S [Acinetobacter sp. ANC 4169]OTG74024.1 hypothetical protein B9T26_07760 [Acinetobacter sp. ANC 4169]